MNTVFDLALKSLKLFSYESNIIRDVLYWGAVTVVNILPVLDSSLKNLSLEKKKGDFRSDQVTS